MLWSCIYHTSYEFSALWFADDHMDKLILKNQVMHIIWFDQMERRRKRNDLFLPLPYLVAVERNLNGDWFLRKEGLLRQSKVCLAYKDDETNGH